MSQTDLNVSSDSGASAATLPTGVGTRRAGERRDVPAAEVSRARRWLGRIGLLGTVACTIWIVLDGASAKSPLVPHQPPIAGWLNGPGMALSYRMFLVILLIMTACYAMAVVGARQVSARWLIGTIAALHFVLFLAPVLISQDVFQYIDYGRLGVLHGINPFAHGPIAAPHDPLFRYVGTIWYHVPSAYGPLFTLVSYPVALLGVEGALWGMKVVAITASLAALTFVWLCAKRLGRDPIAATLIVAINPLWVIYGVGGYHNDLLMVALMMGGVLLLLRDEDAKGAAAIVASAAVKATGIVVLPFALLARRRVGLLVGTAAALAVIGVISLIAFGVHGLDFVSVLKRNSTFVSSDSFPLEVAHLIGLPGVFRIDRTIIRVVSVVAILWFMWRTWRGYDWIAASGWTLLILAVSATWLLAWYLLWALPLAVISKDRRVLWATLAIMAMFVVHQTAPLFSPVQ
jgi:hypothetical protein